MIKYMSKLRKPFLISIVCLFSTSSFVEAADTKVYTWRSENGSVVFSEKKPDHDVDYKTLEVGKPTVVDTKTPQGSEKGSSVEIGQSDVQKLADSQLAEQNKQALEEGQQKELDVQIVSPSAGTNIFSKEDKIPIITNPEIPASANPRFSINGKSAPATYENNQWFIVRPTPGENKLKISGKTAEGNDIKSDEVTFYVKNGWLQQAKNVGNYRGGGKS